MATRAVVEQLGESRGMPENTESRLENRKRTYCIWDTYRVIRVHPIPSEEQVQPPLLCTVAGLRKVFARGSPHKEWVDFAGTCPPPFARAGAR